MTGSTAADAGHRLVALAENCLPQDFAVTGDEDAWPLFAAGLVARMTTTLATVMVLRKHRRAIDASILVRSIYEHAVHLAWLAADPSAGRIERWRRHDIYARLKAGTDARAHGIELFTDAERARKQAEYDLLKGAPLQLTTMAVEADKHWAGKLPGMGKHNEAQSFSGFYAVLYRDYSALAHPSLRGLNSVIDAVSPTGRRVQPEDGIEWKQPYGKASIVFALALYVVDATLGWPDRPEIGATFK